MVLWVVLFAPALYAAHAAFKCSSDGCVNMAAGLRRHKGRAESTRGIWGEDKQETSRQKANATPAGILRNSDGHTRTGSRETTQTKKTKGDSGALVEGR